MYCLQNISIVLKRTFISLVCIFIVLNSFAQKSMPFSVNSKTKSKNIEQVRNIELAAGYIPKNNENALKGFLTVNNVIFKRFGVYTSLEYDLSTTDLTNTLGGTVSLHKYFYLWGGLDLFSKNGFIENGFHGPRKEIGIGITPYKLSVLRIGWSNSVGVSIAAGIGIPF